MSYYKKIRIIALLCLVLTLASLIGAINSAYWEFSQAVVLSFVTIFLFIISVLLFKESIDPSTKAQTLVVPVSEITPEPELSPPQVSTQPDEQNSGASKGNVLLVFAGIAGVISLIAYMDGSRYGGSGSMGGLLDYAILAVSVPATLILGLIGLVMKLSESNK